MVEITEQNAVINSSTFASYQDWSTQPDHIEDCTALETACVNIPGASNPTNGGQFEGDSTRYKNTRPRKLLEVAAPLRLKT